MKNFFYLIGISALFLISSCNNEDIPQSTLEISEVPEISEVKRYTPVVQGVFGQLVDANPEIGTRAGFIEENEDYKSTGEQFYWHDGDKVKLLFFPQGELDADPEELIYTAVVADGERPGWVQFVSDDEIDGGNYTVFALYPADGWSQDEGTGNWGVSIDPDHATAEYIPVTDNTSRHLDRYMYMKADAGDVTIGDEGNTPIELNFEYLTSVIRIKIVNNNPPNPQYSRLFRLSMGVYVDGADEGFNADFVPVTAYLDGGIDQTELTPGFMTNAARIQIPESITNLNMLEFDLFIPILPGGAFPVRVGDDENGPNYFTFAGTFYDVNGIEQPRVYISVPGGGPLPDGFLAGRNYYFDLVIPDLDN